ncbi:MAG: thiamine pyrophosphate-binding protein [Rhodospirillaceae bacterium]|nr:thiamine pyrophosphate-binding protein [Rhodospirillaceae bacterium]
MPDAPSTVGDLVAAFLDACGVRTAFGVISIHNMPVLDAFARGNRMRFVPARGEAGALNMADAFARVSGGLGVGVTSTGVAAGNAAGSLVEAWTAGSPVLHLTGQIERGWLDRGWGYIHEAPDQPTMLRGVSKAFFRVGAPEETLDVLREAVRTARTPPAGPVSVEIPIDVQSAPVEIPGSLAAPRIARTRPAPADLDALAEAVAGARRPVLWLGGGARGADSAALRLADMGVGIVTSTNGRGVVPETHPMTLGAFNAAPPVEDFYGTCDLLAVVGSRLRGNETLKWNLGLPEQRWRVDCDPSMDGRGYTTARFVQGDAVAALGGLADRLTGRLRIDPAFAPDLGAARQAAEAGLRANLGEGWSAVLDAVKAHFPAGSPWVRDITLSNSIWGNRAVPLTGSRQGVHSLGGAIGQGLPMAVGAALAEPGRRTVALVGDGGFALNVGELATAAQEKAPVTILLMNDGGYGVIRNIQDARYGGRRHYADLLTPDFAALCASMGVRHLKAGSVEAFRQALPKALEGDGPAVLEVDMAGIGPFARPFAGPPVREKEGREKKGSAAP